jgi:hypothetical protein
MRQGRYSLTADSRQRQDELLNSRAKRTWGDPSDEDRRAGLAEAVVFRY